MSIEANKALMRRIFEEVLPAKDFRRIKELVSEEYLYRTPGGPELHGHEGFKQLITNHRRSFPDIRFTDIEMIAEGDKVVSRYIIRGTHQGDLEGFAPSGKKVAIPVIVISTIHDGKLIEDFEIVDTLDLLQQIEVMPEEEREY